MNNVISFIMLIYLILALSYKIYRLKKLRRIAQDLLPDDDVVQDVVQEEDYNGNNLYIREEDRTVWDSLSRKRKREIMKIQEKLIKSGKYIIIDTEEGKRIITRAEAHNNGLI